MMNTENCRYRYMDYIKSYAVITSSTITLLCAIVSIIIVIIFITNYIREEHTLCAAVCPVSSSCSKSRRRLLVMRSQMNKITQASDDFTQSLFKALI